MRAFNLLLACLWLGTAGLPAQVDEMDVNEGHIGITLSRAKDSTFLTVDQVAIKSSADEAGIKVGDCVTALDGVSTQGMSLADSEQRLQGAIGSVVKLTIRRNSGTPIDVSVVRRSLLDTILSTATEGDATAEFELGYFYEHGPTSTRDTTKAAVWYQKAAEQGHAWAQAYLASLYRHGDGVPKDPHAATAWSMKSAAQGNALGERELAMCYFRGEGVTLSYRDAFNWFYSAASQDDAIAEEYLGSCYRNGLGVAQDDRQSFNWYYRSAERNDAYGQWGLAYMYENGRGVKQNLVEALKWYQKALALLPQNDGLKRDAALASLKALMDNPTSTSLDTSQFMLAFGPAVMVFFILLALAYVFGAMVLIYFSLRTTDRLPSLALALGWLVFFLESQMVALLAIFVFGKTLDAETLFIATSLFTALPVIASTCGQNRVRIWRASDVSWKKLVLYGAGSCLAIFMLSFGYNMLYALVVHAPIPAQPTALLISKTKHASVWLSYAIIALILPATEEILFRGYLFDALLRRFSGTIAVCGSAFAFSLFHFQWIYFVTLVGYGLIIGWVKLKTNSLRVTLFLHAMNNGLFLALLS